MVVFNVYTWYRPCPHGPLVVTQSGQVAHPSIIDRPENTAFYYVNPDFPCPDCTNAVVYPTLPPFINFTLPAQPTYHWSRQLDPSVPAFTPQQPSPSPEPYQSTVHEQQALDRQQRPPRPRPYHHNRGHREGMPCPQRDQRFHWHNPFQHCHVHWTQCRFAANAIRASYQARNAWYGAPLGWNADHVACIREVNPQRCHYHQRVHNELVSGPPAQQ